MSGLLRICTAGSVDDGKSTLIGRLLHDSQSVYEDQIHSVEKASKNRDAGPIDFSLFTDGLRAEREQGITIDVAYRYFATARRKFILADTPGHEQYTRNMATGASTADLAILLIDARQGVRVQSRRHARIARLLGITDFVLAINKMDLVDFDRDVYEGIRDEFEEMLVGARVHAIPISALHGDNVITRSDRTPWFEGPSLLEYLGDRRSRSATSALPFRFPRAAGEPAESRLPRICRARSLGRPSGPATGSSRRPLAAPRASTVSSPTTATSIAHAPMSVTLTLGRRDRHQPRRHAVGRRRPTVGTQFRGRGRLDGRAAARPGAGVSDEALHEDRHRRDPSRPRAEPDRHGERVDRASARLRPLHRQPRDRQLHHHRPGDALHRRRRHDPQPRDTGRRQKAPVSAAERLALLARRAGSDAEAVDAIRKALEDLLS